MTDFVRVGVRCLAVGLTVVLAGCDNVPDTGELHDYLRAVQARPGLALEPLPHALAAPAFVYDAMALRSPFQALPEFETGRWQVSLLTEGPDQYRVRTHLETIDLEQFEMVGTLSNGVEYNALLRAGGRVHRLKMGDALGRNNGQVAWVSATGVEVFEVIPDGRGGWLQRSLTIPLKQQS